MTVMMYMTDMALAKQQRQPLTDEATESDVDNDDDDSSLDSSPFASPRQLRTPALISSASAIELASLGDDDSNGKFIVFLVIYLLSLSEPAQKSSLCPCLFGRHGLEYGSVLSLSKSMDCLKSSQVGVRKFRWWSAGACLVISTS